MFRAVLYLEEFFMESCPCASGREYDLCCGAIIDGTRDAPSAEALMRSRYSAFVKGKLDHLRESLHPDSRHDYDPLSTQKWSEQSEWEKLDVLNSCGGENDDAGVVEFVATYRQKGAWLVHHELAEFRRLQGRWYYVDGKLVSPGTVRNKGPRPGRNDPCPCGSGKKHKKCCGS